MTIQSDINHAILALENASDCMKSTKRMLSDIMQSMPKSTPQWVIEELNVVLGRL